MNTSYNQSGKFQLYSLFADICNKAFFIPTGIDCTCHLVLIGLKDPFQFFDFFAGGDDVFIIVFYSSQLFSGLLHRA
jgi:hypothetical protein